MIIKKINISFEYKAILSIAFFAVALMYLVRWNGNSGENYRQIIRSDGYGYYDYFPMLFGSESIKDRKANGIYLVKTSDDKVVNKYFIGTSLLQSPFVLTTAGIKLLLGKPIDFHSEAFQKSVSIAAIFYLIIGLIALSKLLRIYNLQKHIIEFSLFAIFFGTNLLYYSIIDSSMSHVYSFAMISVFLLFAKRFSIDMSFKNFFLAVFFASLIFLIRPLNIIIVLLIPFIFSPFSKLYENKRRFLLQIALALVIFTIPLSLQLLVWKAQTGNFIVWSYANEGFYFSHPAIFDFLFSFRKGLFIYSPLVFISILLFFIAKRNSLKDKLVIFSFLTILVYLFSSWWNWYYGDSYGSRVFIDFLPLICVLLALGLYHSKAITQRVSVVIISLFIVLNILQSYQYYHNIMSHFDMNVEKYKYIFGKFGSEYENCLGGNNDIVLYHKKPLQKILGRSINFNQNNCKYLINSLQKLDSNTVLFNNNEYGLNFILPAKLIYSYRSAYVELQNSILLLNGNMEKSFWTVSYLDSAKNVYAYYKIKINEIPASIGKERSNLYKFALYKPLHYNDLIQISVWNYSKAEFQLSNLKVNISGIER